MRKPTLAQMGYKTTERVESLRKETLPPGFIDIKPGEFTWLLGAMEAVLTKWPGGYSLPIQVPVREEWAGYFSPDVIGEVEAALIAGTVVYFVHTHKYGDKRTVGVLARPTEGGR